MPWQAEAVQAGFSTREPWLPIDPTHLPLSVDRQEADPASLLHLTRRLVALRKRYAALRTGIIRPVGVEPPLLAFERGEGDDRLLCVFNLGDRAADWPVPHGWRVIERVGRELEPMSGWIAERMR
jgi:alpha-glucosidase